MATRKAKCIKRGRHNKCLKRAHRMSGMGRVRHHRICRKSNGQIKKCTRSRKHR